MMCPDNYSAFEQHSDKQEREHEKWYDSLPTCDHCGEKIQDDYLIDIEGFLYHETCFETLHRKNTDDYVD